MLGLWICIEHNALIYFSSCALKKIVLGLKLY